MCNWRNEVRTIFVLGFPSDVKERELQNLLRWWPGYEASQMNFKCDQPMGFALFSTVAMAMAARDALQNLVFDADTNSVLRAEMAKKNLFVKRGVAGDPCISFDGSKRMRTGGGDYSPAPYSAPYPSTYLTQPMTSPTPAWAPQTYGLPQPQYDQYGAYVAPQPLPITPSGYAPVQNTKDNPPCNTLFIGNLGEAVNEIELRALFSGQLGFRQMKVLRQGKNIVCFIEFLDVNSAMLVHTNLQGAVLSTSDRGGMRIQFSKNPYGRKREGGGNTHYDLGVTTPSVEVNGSVEYMVPSV
nr:RNA-binding protein with multiple splicing-like isoform X3 [Physcomitrium patens]|eukprot:XP_024363552.1 RNA-binding protein with multiple splicing-like isoform X3 [Physcomitrella patens]